VKVHTALANLFVQEGVTNVFGLMGTANMEWWRDLAKPAPADAGSASYPYRSDLVR